MRALTVVRRLEAIRREQTQTPPCTTRCERPAGIHRLVQPRPHLFAP
jgi:hypothetical protein